VIAGKSKHSLIFGPAGSKPGPDRPNAKWSMDFMSAKLFGGRWFRVLTIIDQFTRECLALVADRALNGHRVALALSQVVAERGVPIAGKR
jgi:putative transposase